MLISHVDFTHVRKVSAPSNPPSNPESSSLQQTVNFMYAERIANQPMNQMQFLSQMVQPLNPMTAALFHGGGLLSQIGQLTQQFTQPMPPRSPTLSSNTSPASPVISPVISQSSPSLRPSNQVSRTTLPWR